MQALKKLIDVDKVFAILGTAGSSHLPAMVQTIEENQIPALNFAAVAGAHFTPRARQCSTSAPPIARRATVS